MLAASGYIGEKNMNLAAIKGPVVLAQTEKRGYRDPAAFYHEGTCYLYFTMVEQEGAEQISPLDSAKVRISYIGANR